MSPKSQIQMGNDGNHTPSFWIFQVAGLIVAPAKLVLSMGKAERIGDAHLKSLLRSAVGDKITANFVDLQHVAWAPVAVFIKK